MKKSFVLVLALMSLIVLAGVSALSTTSNQIYYNFDNINLTGSNPQDITGNGRIGTNYFATTGVTGLLRQAFSYNGATSNVTVLYTTPSAYTLNAWAKTSATGYGNILGWTYTSGGCGGSANGQGIRISSGRVIQFNGFCSTVHINGATATAEQWYMITATKSGTTYKLYVDGVLQGTTSGTIIASPKIVVGSHADYVPVPFDGIIDEVSVWSKALNQTEITELYNSGNGLTYPYIPSDSFQLTAFDNYDSSIIYSFNATMVNTTDSFFYETTNSTIVSNLTFLSGQIWNITLKAPNYFDESRYTYNLSDGSINIGMNKSMILITASNLLSNESIETFSVTLKNNSQTYSTTTGSISIPLGLGLMSFNASSPGYTAKPEFDQTSATLGDYAYEINFPATYRFEFWDEKTIMPFNMSSFDNMQFQVYCPDTTQIYELTSTSQNYTQDIDCFFTKLRFQLQYGTDVYYRTLILPYTGVEKNVYLLDLTNTTSVFNTFTVFDLLGTYENVSLFFEKRINSDTEQIIGDYVDAEGKVPAYLMLAGDYIIKLKSDNMPERVIGTYTADTAGDKIIRLFDISLATTIKDYDGAASSYIYKTNESGSLYIRAAWNDTTSTTTGVAFNVYNSTGENLVTQTSTASNVLFSYAIPSAYNRDNLRITLNITNPTWGARDYSRTIKPITSITLPGTFDSPYTLKFIIFGVLIVFALMFTVTTANWGALILVGIAGILSYLGIFVIAAPILGLAAMLAIFQVYKSGDRGGN